MGCYNTILVRCKCGRHLAFQSKSGSASMMTYRISAMPEEDYKGIDGDSQECECGRVTTIGGRDPDTVDMSDKVRTR